MKNMIPFMSVRDIVLFPGHQVTLFIGRPFTKKSIKKALGDFNAQIVVAAQRDLEANEQPELNELFSVGCLCNIEEMIEFPDSQMKILIKPQFRVKLKTLKDATDAIFCSFEKLPDFKPEKILDESRSKIIQSLEPILRESKCESSLQLLRRLKKETNGYKFVMGVGRLINMPELVYQVQPTVEQMNAGIHPFELLSADQKTKIKVRLARIQELLEVNSLKLALTKIEALIAATP